MSGIDQKKLLIIMITFVIIINYNNYWSPDRKKLWREIELIQSKIEREKILNNEKNSSLKFDVQWNRFFFDGKSLNYSQAMGSLQKEVQSAANKCELVALTWAQVPSNEQDYDRLRMNMVLRCPPNEFFPFFNRIRKSGKLVLFKNFRVTPSRDNKKLHINAQIIAFRSHYVP